MKRFIILWLIPILAVALFGAYGRSTHTNLVNYQDLSGVYEAEVGYHLMTPMEPEVKQEIMDWFAAEELIAIVQATGNNRQFGERTLMEVKILQVIQGDPSVEGETVDFVSDFYFSMIGVEAGYVPLCTGALVNYMKQGNEYLISMSEWPRPRGWTDTLGHYYYSSQHSVVPYLNLDDIPNQLPEQIEDRQSPPRYKEMPDNEVFILNEESLASFLELKHTIFSLYLKA